MSTKVSLHLCDDAARGTTPHLHEECFAPADFPVFLKLTGVTEAPIELAEHGNTVTIAIQPSLAKKGLQPPERQLT